MRLLGDFEGCMVWLNVYGDLVAWGPAVPMSTSMWEPMPRNWTYG